MDKIYVGGLRQALLEYVQGQIAFHQGIVQTHRAYSRKLTGYSRFAFFVVLVACIVDSLEHAAEQYLTLIHAHIPALVTQICVAIACIAAAFGFGLGVWIHQLGFEQIASRSESVIEKLMEIQSRIEADGNSWSRVGLQPWLDHTAQVLAQEQMAWFRQASLVGIHL